MAATIKTDVLVVGSGPAGSVAARYAAEKGVSVLFLERRPQVGVPVRCGELIPSLAEIRGMFPKLTDGETLFGTPADLHRREIAGITLTDPKGKTRLLPFTAYTTDRDRFDQHLAQRAQEAGAELRTSTMFRRITDGKADTTAGTVEYKVLIGADGPGSKVAQSLGLAANRNPYPAVTAQVEGEFEPNVQMFFGGIAPGAYSWIIPKDHRANVGVGFSPAFSNGTLSEYFAKFAELHDFKITTKLEGKYVPSEGPIKQTVVGNGLVVGDAAGQVLSVNGGGVPLAMIAGRIAGQIAADHVKNGRPLTDYEQAWRDVLYKPLHIAADNKKLADTFAFGSDTRTRWCMDILGTRRMAKLIRGQHLFP